MFVRAPIVLSALVLLAPPVLSAGGKDKTTTTVPARTRSPFDAILRLDATGKAHSLGLNAEIAAGQTILSPPGSRGLLDVAQGDLRVSLVGNLPGLTPSSTLESSVVLDPPGKFDLNLRLVRGLVIVESARAKGSAQVRLQIADKHLDVAMPDKSAIALELMTYWPQGTRFDPKAKDQPRGELLFFVLQGKVDVTMEEEKHFLTAPVMYRWTTDQGVEGPLSLSKLPEWYEAPKDPAPKKKKGMMKMKKDKGPKKGPTAKENAAEDPRWSMLLAVEKVRLASEKEKDVVAFALKHADPLVRRIGVFRAAALDRDQTLFEVLNTDRSREVRTAALLALKHQIGQSRAALNGFYQGSKLDDGRKKILLFLLLGLEAEARRRPETYEALIGYLDHDVQAIRSVAGEVLAGLVPAGKEIGFDAAGDAAARRQAQAAWRKLIPAGKLPPQK